MTVVDYQSKFLALVTRCIGLIERHQIDIFTNGLRNPLKTDIKLEASATLEDAMALARTYEQRYRWGQSRCRMRTSVDHLAVPVPLPRPWLCPLDLPRQRRRHPT
jgi:hypothetical protein